MTFRSITGSVAALFYSGVVGRIPFHCVRNLYLRWYLGGFDDGASVQLGCRFLNGRKVRLGQRTVVNFGCLLDGRSHEVRIGSDVSIGPEASILTLGHDPQSAEFADRGGDVVIGDHVWIGYRAIILPGITIGDGVVVGAGAVVTKDVEPYSIMVGNPARKIGERSRNLAYELNYSPWLQ